MYSAIISNKKELHKFISNMTTNFMGKMHRYSTECSCGWVEYFTAADGMVYKHTCGSIVSAEARFKKHYVDGIVLST